MSTDKGVGKHAREARPRRGQRVAFTPADDMSAQHSDTVIGLRFTVDTAHGGSALIDLVELRPRRLTLAFGAALREIAPSMVRTTVIQHVNGLKRFFAFLNKTAPNIAARKTANSQHAVESDTFFLIV